jgi:hypothetical protein
MHKSTAPRHHGLWTILLALIGGIVWAGPQLHARGTAQWSDSPPAIREWFQSLTQPDNPVMSCCGESDAFEADTFEVEGDHYVAIITDGRGQIPNGTRIPVPNYKMKWDASNPTGHGILFLCASCDRSGPNVQPVYCYVAPGGV